MVISKELNLKKIKEHFSKKYTEEDVQYSVKNLFQGGFLEGNYTEDANHHFSGCHIYDVTYNGHIFADSIRPESIWKKSKDKIKILGVSSIKMLSAVCVEVAKVMVTDPKFIADIAKNL